MMSQDRPVGEDDLHAYVDGHLDTDCRTAVERYLACHPDQFARVAGWRAVDQALRAALARKAQEPVPAALNLARLVEERLSRRRATWEIAAAVVLAFAIGAGSGWMAHRPRATTGLAAVALEAAAAYRVFATDPMHPVEFGAGQTSELVSWVTRRLGRPVAPPDLSAAGYRLMGGRVLATQDGPACMFLYDNSEGQRITLFVRPMLKRDMNAAMRPMRANNITGFAWARNGLGFGLVAGAPLLRLHELSNRIRDEMIHGIGTGRQPTGARPRQQF